MGFPRLPRFPPFRALNLRSGRDNPHNSENRARPEDPRARPMDASSGGTGGGGETDSNLYLPYYRFKLEKTLPRKFDQY